MALRAHVRPADVLLDADLRRIEPVALAHLMPDAGKGVRRSAQPADLLLLRQIVLDRDAREVRRDRLAPATVLALVRAHWRGARTLDLLGRLDRRQYLDFVEQQSLIRAHRS